MPVQLHHTIVNVLDPDASARWLAELLGLPAPYRFGPFMVVELANGVSLDHHDGGRGVYWEDPDGHMLEIITRPYGVTPRAASRRNFFRNFD